MATPSAQTNSLRLRPPPHWPPDIPLHMTPPSPLRIPFQIIAWPLLRPHLVAHARDRPLQLRPLLYLVQLTMKESLSL